MNKFREAADRGTGILRGAWDAARGTEYEPLQGRSEVSPRERAVYERWVTYKPARNACERTAYQSLPRELDAEMDRAEQSAGEDEAARDWDAEIAQAAEDARDWAARASRAAEAAREAGQ